MEKALFFRKCSNCNEYNYLSKKLPSFGQLIDYEIIAIVQLEEIEYSNFTHNFLTDNNHIEKLKDRATMNERDCVSCILFTSNLKEGFLVYPSGYNYARYIASWKGDIRNLNV